MTKSRIVKGFRVGDRSRGRFTTPADFPRHGGAPYRGLRVRRWGLGFAHRSRATLCRAVPNPSVTIRNFCIAVLQCTLPGFTHTHGPNRGGGHLQQLAVLLEDQPLLHHAGSRVDHARLRRQHLVTIDGGGEQLRQWARRRREKCEVVASRGRSVRSIQNTPSDMRRNPPPTLPMPLAHRAVWGCSFIAAIVSETA
jgi:hypothetical protein